MIVMTGQLNKVFLITSIEDEDRIHVIDLHVSSMQNVLNLILNTGVQELVV